MKTKLIIVISLSMIILSCTTNKENTIDNNPNLIEITKAQFESEGMLIGEALLQPFSDAVHFTGTIITSVNGQAQISLPSSGIINRIHTSPGQTISKGGAMFDVAGNEFIDQQKDFAESAAIVARLKSDYERAKELYDENISTKKEYTFAESSYYAENAKYKALKIKLENIGLDVSRIEKGEFYSSYTVKAPIDGFVASIGATIGQYVSPQERIAEIINDKAFKIKLSIFEQDIHKIATGQTVAFYLNGNKAAHYKATINVVGKTILLGSKSIDCFATIEQPKSMQMVNNQFVEGVVYTKIDSVLAVPETAVVYAENNAYLLMYEKEEDTSFFFQKVKVTTGRIANNYIEITDQLPKGNLLVKGIYNIQIESLQ